MKNLAYLSFLLAFVLLLTSCDSKEGSHITRIEVQKANTAGDNGEVTSIAEEEKVERVHSVFEKIEWEPNMSALEGNFLRVTFFYEPPPDGTEPLLSNEYEVWFHSNGTSIIRRQHEREDHGVVNKKGTEILKEELINKE